MRVQVTKTELYKFDELDEKAKEKALDSLYYINVENDWWDYNYENAENIGLKLEGFDIDRGSYCKGKFIDSAEETAHKIEKEHGENCDTFKTAKDYLEKRDAIIENEPKDENGDFVSEWELDNKLDSLDAGFLHDLLEDYLSMLRQEYEYQTSKEAIIETIEANDYEFTKDGKPQ